MANYPNEINSAILISPNIFPYDKRTNIVYYPWGRQIAYLITGGYNKFETKEYKRKEHPTIKSHSSRVQHVDAIIAMMGLVTLLNSYNFNEIKIPLIITHTPNDHTVDPIKINEFIKNYGVKKRIFPSYFLKIHTLTYLLETKATKAPKTHHTSQSNVFDFINKINK